MDGPQIKELSYKRRQALFFILLFVFLFALPSLIFYTTGYRLDFDNEDSNIVTVGGVYVTNDNLEVDVYIDGERVEKPRLFRSAYYIQNIASGQHRIVVQRPDLTTWVKELPVDPHIVIEAAAFNMPAIPHLRPVTKYVTATGTPLYVKASSTKQIFTGVSTTEPIREVLSMKEVESEVNEEYVYVESLFSTSTEERLSVFDRLLDGVERFRFATTTDPLLESATGTEELVIKGDVQILQRDNELYAVWLDTVDNIPHYFCIAGSEASSTAKRYGQHVADQVEKLNKSTTTPIVVDGNRLCRPEIKLDRLRQDVYFYDFFPNSSDLVLLQLEDGLYVTEIDDRAWQNTQLLYPGTDFRVVVENNVIYIKVQDYYFEVITEIEPE